MKCKSFLIVVLCVLSALCSTNFSLAQGPSPHQKDSLLKAWNNPKLHDSLRLEALDRAMYAFVLSNSDTLKLLAEKMLSFARSAKNSKFEGNANFFLAYHIFHKGEIEKAGVYYQSAIDAYKKINFKKGMAAAANGLGNTFLYQSNYAKAIETYISSAKLQAELGNKQGEASVLGNIGGIYFSIKDYGKCYEYNENVRNLFKEIGDKVGVAHSIGNMASAMENFDDSTCLHYGIKPAKKYEKALELHLQSLKLKEGIDDRITEAITLTSVGRMYRLLNDHVKAKMYIEKAIKIATEQEDLGQIAPGFHALANIYYVEKDFAKALVLAQKAYDLGKEVGDYAFLKDYAYTLYEIHKALNNPNKALQYYEENVMMTDSISKDENQKMIFKKGLQFEFDKKEALAKAEQEKIDIETRAKDKVQKIITGGIILVLLMVVFFSFSLYKRFKLTQAQKTEIEHQKEIIEEKSKEVTDSINYAKRIQFSLLAHDDLLHEFLKNYFVLFSPKDIVSGDFYWATKKDDSFYVACCDSTGHGVPGAFMSLLNISFLNEAINEKNIMEPHLILNHVRDRLIKHLSSNSKDGMDATLVRFQFVPNANLPKISYAAANNEPLLIRNHQFLDLGKDKMPVGKGEREGSFSIFEVEPEKGDTLYLFTDGIIDQFGGPDRKKLMRKHFKSLVLENHQSPLNEQQQFFDKFMKEWRGSLKQIDDITLMGIRFE